MRARLFAAQTGDDGKDPATGRQLTSPRPAGTVIDHPEAWMLVRQGCAEPADEECRERAGVTPEQLLRAKTHYEMVERGIAPDDYEPYQAGVMVGYDGEGDWIPGPNYDAWAEAQFDDDLGEIDEEPFEPPAA